MDFRIAALVAYFVTRAAELTIHRANYRLLRKAGAEELIPQLMRRYYIYSLLVVPVSWIEYLLIKQAPPSIAIQIGLVMMASAVLLRTWAISSLGVRWTMRCLALPGVRATGVGPYRYLDSPEYLSRLVEGVGVGLMLGGRISLVAFVLLLSVLQRRITRIESRQLMELSHSIPRYYQTVA